MSKEQTPENIRVSKWINKYKPRFKEYRDYCKKNNWIYAEDVAPEYETQRDIAKIILSRMAVFLKAYGVHQDKKYVQEFIKFMQDPVDQFCKRCDQYYKSVPWSTIEDKKQQQTEMKFQATIQTDHNRILDKIAGLQIDEETSTLDVPIHSSKKIPLLMAEIIENKYPKITDYREQNKIIDVRPSTFTPHDIANNTEMFINMKNVPRYDPDKHYYEQSNDVLQFYAEERIKMVNGVNIGGVFIHPWLYWHVNFFKTDIPMDMLVNTDLYDPEKTRKIMNPFFRDNELFFADNYQKADESDLHLFGYGTRRFAKSILEASHLVWKTTFFQGAESVVVGGSKEDLEKLSSVLQMSFLNVDPAFQLTNNSNDWTKQIRLGLKTKSTKPIPYGNIFIRNVEDGQKRGSQKAAGTTPTAFIIDEAGKFSLAKMWMAALPSFSNSRGTPVTAIIMGTGNEETLSADAKRMLNNPEAFDILPMDWDLLENKYAKDKKYYTWDRKPFGTFFPAQMSVKKGLYKDDTNLADFLQIEDDRLRAIKFKVTNWSRSNEKLKSDRIRKEKDRDALDEEKRFYPMDTRDCFLADRNNPFPSKEASDHMETIIREGLVGKAVTFRRKPGTVNQVLWDFSDKKYADFPFQGGNIDSPIRMFEEPPDDNEKDGTYVAGLDHYKHDKSSGDSIGSLTVYKRGVNLDQWADRVVLTYHSRPDRMEEFNQTCELILEAYGAECLQENADISFQLHLRSKNKESLWLANGEEVMSHNLRMAVTQNNKYGLNPSKRNKDLLLKVAINYCKEPIVIGRDEEGNDIVAKGVTRINDPVLLKEIIEFDFDKNVDRITSFAHALLWARYLDDLGIVPRTKLNKKTQTYRDMQRKQRNRYKTPYSTVRLNPFKG